MIARKINLDSSDYGFQVTLTLDNLGQLSLLNGSVRKGTFINNTYESQAAIDGSLAGRHTFMSDIRTKSVNVQGLDNG